MRRRSRQSAFNQRPRQRHSPYFTVTVFATVGFGDIVAQPTEPRRGDAQMLLNLAALEWYQAEARRRNARGPARSSVRHRPTRAWVRPADQRARLSSVSPSPLPAVMAATSGWQSDARVAAVTGRGPWRCEDLEELKAAVRLAVRRSGGQSAGQRPSSSGASGGRSQRNAERRRNNSGTTRWEPCAAQRYATHVRRGNRIRPRGPNCVGPRTPGNPPATAFQHSTKEK